MTRTFYAYLGCLVIGVGGAVAAACAKAAPNNDFGDGGGGGILGGGDSGIHLGGGGDGGVGGTSPGAVAQSTCTASALCDDFAASTGAACAGSDCVVIGPGATSGTSALFSSAGAAGGPCLIEPQDGTLFPNGGTDGTGWLQPRISFAATSATQNMFQIRLHSAVEQHDLVVYTANTYWPIDLPTWISLSKNMVGPAITVTVSATSSSGGAVVSSSPASFTIASLEAEGSLIYWTTANHDNSATSTSLNGFHVGDTGSATVLMSNQVAQQVVASPVDGGNTTDKPVGVFCIGCHTATPDGNYVAFTSQWPWANALASPAAATVGQSPPWLTAGAIANLSPVAGPASGNTTWYEPPQINQVMLGIQTFSAGHFATGDRIVITTLGAAENATALDAATTQTGVVSQLAWINLEYAGAVSSDGGLPLATCSGANAGGCLPQQNHNAGWGVLARTGSADLGSAGAPSWSHNRNGTTDYIAYTTSPFGTKDGRMNDGPADIAIVPYNSLGPGLGGAGGAVQALPGASDPNFNEYYPAWSPDDSLIAFNRVPSGMVMYEQPSAEVLVVPTSGTATCDGMATTPCDLKANVPVTCTGSLPGTVENTWPKWAPLPTTSGNKGSDGKLYYWVTFSSTRVTGCTMAGSNVCAATDAANAVGKAQLYVAGIVVDPTTGNISTFPAIYLWNQDFSDNNLIPAWDYFPLPPGTGTQPPK
jgi:hypothetical protein